MEEQWKPVVGFEELYMISNCGRLKSLKRTNNSGVHPIMKTHMNKLGYIEVQLRKQGKKYTVKLHRLVAEAFIGSAPEKNSIVLHLDLDRVNNHSSNLQWSTKREAILSGRWKSNLPIINPPSESQLVGQISVNLNHH